MGGFLECQSARRAVQTYECMDIEMMTARRRLTVGRVNPIHSLRCHHLNHLGYMITKPVRLSGRR